MFFDFVIDSEWMRFSRTRLVVLIFARLFLEVGIYTVSIFAHLERRAAAAEDRVALRCLWNRTECSPGTHNSFSGITAELAFDSCVRNAGVQMEWRLCG